MSRDAIWPRRSASILACVAVLLGVVPAARAAEYRYYFAPGEATHVQPSRFHAAVVTPSRAERAKLEATLAAAFGPGVRFVDLRAEGLAVVGVPQGSFAVSLAAVLEQAGFATRFAFSGHWPDGGEAWPTVVMPELRVRFPSAAAAGREIAELKARGLSVVWQRREGTDFLLRSGSSEAALTIAAELVESGRAVFAYPDMLMRHVRHFEPNDAYFDEQWHLPIIGAPATWDRWHGSSNVIIAIIDSGVDRAHLDLVPNLGGGFDIVGDGYVTDLDPHPTGDDAHGTACAGLAAAAGDNRLGVTGVCFECRLMPIRIMGETYYRASTDEDAFRWARSHGADVLSNSWGPAQPIDYNYFPPGLRDEIHAAVQENKVVLFAAGNEGNPLTCPNGTPWEPAAYSEVISVGATNWYDSREDYSNYGSSDCPLTLVAPAGSVTTDISGSRGYDYGDYTQSFGGTSAATPVTAGAVGLLLSIDPSLTWGQVVDALERSADKIGGVTYDADGYNRYYGWGRLNLYRAASYVGSGNLCQPETDGEVFGLPACGDGVDNDCDGMVDDADPSCAPDDVAIGSACVGGECGSQGKLCLDTFPEGGYCTGLCGPGDTCEAGAVCWTCYCDTGPGTQSGCACDPDGCACDTTAECDPDAANQYACECDPNCNLCLDRCLADTECRRGYVCEYISDTEQACYPGCASGLWACEPPETCSAATGRCEHDGPAPAGDPCTDYLQCADNGWCLDDASGWPGGYCSPECDADGSCPASATCVHFVDVNFCFVPCAEKSECRLGYGCWSGFLPDGRICWPSCTAADCAEGEVCCATTGGCEPEADCAEDDACPCNQTPACDPDCSCDPDCCACDTTTACDAGCACDPNCGGGDVCPCDVDATCPDDYQSVCPCDANCPCLCDVDVTCPDNYASVCGCDVDCPCACDQVVGCDEGCECDPDCYTDSGCSCSGAAASQAGALFGGLWAFLMALRRRRNGRGMGEQRV